jgi:hypothetical protein
MSSDAAEREVLAEGRFLAFVRTGLTLAGDRIPRPSPPG